MKKQTKVKDLTGKEVIRESISFNIPQEEVDAFLQITGIVLIGDDRLKTIQTHFIEMIKRNNENIK